MLIFFLATARLPGSISLCRKCAFTSDAPLYFPPSNLQLAIFNHPCSAASLKIFYRFPKSLAEVLVKFCQSLTSKLYLQLYAIMADQTCQGLAFKTLAGKVSVPSSLKWHGAGPHRRELNENLYKK